MDIRENFSENLKEIMKERKMSLDEFADFLGISRSMLQVYLKGEGNPRLDTLEEIAKKLEISVFELLGVPPREERVNLEDIRRILETLVEGYRNLFVYLLSAKLVTREQEDGSGKSDNAKSLGLRL